MIQLASNPKLLLKASPELQFLEEFKIATRNIPPKIRIAVSRAFELAERGEKIIIWSNFIETIKYLEKLLQPLNAITIYGETPVGDSKNADTREGKLKRFKEFKNNYFAMIANPMAASEGISLQNTCYYQLFIDRNYDARLFEQAVNRNHRVGLFKDKIVKVEILMLEDSVDINIDKSLEVKLKNMYRILNDCQISVETEEEIDESEYIRKFGSYSGMNSDDANDLLHSIFSSRKWYKE